MVIIKDDNKLPRLQRRKSAIQELITDRDRNVTGAVVGDIDNKGKIITLKRDCKHLIPLNLQKTSQKMIQNVQLQ